jgi:hypothetical protein
MLFTRCEANTHQILRGSTGTNPRESLMEYLACLSLNILTQGNKPTYVMHNRKVVTDLTLGKNERRPGK